MVRSAEPAPLRRLAGRTVTAVEPRGKHLLIHFDDGLVLHSHMRMNGSWHVYAPGQPWRKPAHMARAVLAFDDVVAVAFNAPIMELVREPPGAGTAPDPVAHLGPDILADDIDFHEVLGRARAAGVPTLGELLLNQRVCAGIGNIYKCESLWAHRLDPWMPPVRLDDATLLAVYQTARRMMRESAVAAHPGGPRAGHGRGGRPCPRCGSPVRVQPQGEHGRLTYHCPRCQAGTGVAGAARSVVRSIE